MSEPRESLFRFRPMIAGVTRYLRDLRDGFRVLRSRDFWRAFAEFWSGPAIAARMDEWTHAVRENLGMPPDEQVEQRRARRRHGSA